ncbi:MAG: DUF1570 domain-containing protein [Planctomycetaceae bacterium]|nr:DUF1570 domain-containing protein [Planctomycetaceae bacterium]
MFALSLGMFVCGCRTPPATFSVQRPEQHSVRTAHFVIHSDSPIAHDAPLVTELETIRNQLTECLNLPSQRDEVVVYLFPNEESYRRYMHTTWPTLPARRAYFVGTSRELAVYSFLSPRIQEDLRHEFTHGLLHASLNTVPLWLDEGLAEYFEVAGASPGAPHRSHVRLLQKARAEGWNPSLYHLEHLTDFRKMTQRDYAEAWGWVHFMLHEDEQTRKTLLDYVAELSTKTVAPQLLPRLEASTPNYFNAMVGHVSSLAQGITVASNEEPLTAE